MVYGPVKGEGSRYAERTREGISNRGFRMSSVSDPLRRKVKFGTTEEQTNKKQNKTFVLYFGVIKTPFDHF